jgi:hypothetical protein
MFAQDFTAVAALQVKDRNDVYEYAKAQKLPANSQLFVALRKGPSDRPFEIPMQGYYRGVLPASGTKAWQELR